MLMKLSVGSRDGQGGGKKQESVLAVLCVVGRWVGPSRLAAVARERGIGFSLSALLGGGPFPPLLSSIRLSGPKGREKKRKGLESDRFLFFGGEERKKVCRAGEQRTPPA